MLYCTYHGGLLSANCKFLIHYNWIWERDIEVARPPTLFRTWLFIQASRTHILHIIASPRLATRSWLDLCCFGISARVTCDITVIKSPYSYHLVLLIAVGQTDSLSVLDFVRLRYNHNNGITDFHQYHESRSAVHVGYDFTHLINQRGTTGRFFALFLSQILFFTSKHLNSL